MHDGTVRALTDVWYVPELKKNIISLGTLQCNGSKYTANGGVWRVMKGTVVVMTKNKANSTYLV